jgi:hypothetical protein
MKPIDMTIYWKALEEHFLVVQLVFRFNYLRGRNAFSEFILKTLFLKELPVIPQLVILSQFNVCSRDTPLSTEFLNPKRFHHTFPCYLGHQNSASRTTLLSPLALTVAKSAPLVTRPYNCIVLTTFNIVKGAPHVPKITKKVPKLAPPKKIFLGVIDPPEAFSVPQNAQFCS